MAYVQTTLFLIIGLTAADFSEYCYFAIQAMLVCEAR
jgi:hypothetical protein